MMDPLECNFEADINFLGSGNSGVDERIYYLGLRVMEELVVAKGE